MGCFAPLRRVGAGGGRSNPSVISRCGGLLPSASADLRSSGDAIVFEGNRQPQASTRRKPSSSRARTLRQ